MLHLLATIINVIWCVLHWYRSLNWMHSWRCSISGWHKPVPGHSGSMLLWGLEHCVWQQLGYCWCKCCLQAAWPLKHRWASCKSVDMKCSLYTNILCYRCNFSSLWILWPRKWTNIYVKCALQWKWDTPCQLLPQHTSILFTLLWCWSRVPRWVSPNPRACTSFAG